MAADPFLRRTLGIRIIDRSSHAGDFDVVHKSLYSGGVARQKRAEQTAIRFQRRSVVGIDIRVQNAVAQIQLPANGFQVPIVSIKTAEPSIAPRDPTPINKNGFALPPRLVPKKTIT